MEDISSRSMTITRTFEAPIELVWKVLTTPEYISVWWGPEGFTNTIRTMDVREGGIFDFTMHAPDGTDFINFYHYQEVKPLQKLVMEHKEHPKFNIVVELFQEGEHTKVTWTNIFDSAPTMEETIRAFKADVGLIQNIERLSEFVKRLNV
ncbi:SRPBCC domain-containing protein [Roseivirga sp.]|uniref:SRPBCC domain-containing protein n=1 Tax=Roseivirga sp. TaxID=1964215 RepID=UPI003B51B6B2